MHQVLDPYVQLREQLDAAPFARLLRMSIQRLTEGEAIVSMRVEQRVDNWIGRTHGGAIMSLADHALAACAATMPGTPSVVQFNINFISPPTKNEEIVAAARRIHATRRIALLHFEVRDPSQRLLAQGQATALSQS